ncbi:MAG TPA: hypothetical protein PKI62_11450 [bacterium]|nr:hypothetical protein [bacterium]HPR87970.1 hypothetical protein [bacterium]
MSITFVQGNGAQDPAGEISGRLGLRHMGEQPSHFGLLVEADLLVRMLLQPGLPDTALGLSQISVEGLLHQGRYGVRLHS